MELFFIGLGEFICLALLPISIIWLIACLVRKSSKKKPIIIMAFSIVGLIVLAIISDTFYHDEMEQNRIERESREVEEASYAAQKIVEESEREQQESAPESQLVETSIEETDTTEAEETLTQIQAEVEQTTEEISETEETSVQENQSLSSEEGLIAVLNEIMPGETAKKAYDILVNQIGFTDITYIGQNAMGATNFDFDSKEYKFTLTAGDDVYRIFQPNGGAVFYEDGEVKVTVSELKDRTISHYDRTSYYFMAQMIVEQGLKNPKSAKFPSIITRPEEIAMSKNGDIIAVQSYVDAQNSFGATMRSKWTVQYQVIDIDTYSYVPLYLGIDGEVIYGEWFDME